MSTRAELLASVRQRYEAAPRREKRRILDEFVAVSGYHRKHAIRLLRSDSRECAARRPPQRRYDGRVREGLIVLWECSDRLCSKRLKPLIPALLPALERHDKLVLDDATRACLLSVSPATIDRLLSETRIAAAGGRRRRAGSSSAVRRAVPVRTFADWNSPPPGFVEVDLVAHGGASVSGSFVQTLVLTDIATGWTECIPIVVRESTLVIEAIARARRLFPFPLRGVDFDNDSLFMNETVVSWCRESGLEVTRARAYRKNDQAWVEQKNGAIVRRLVGYGRFEGVVSAQALARLYAAARLHTNLVQPSFKLKTKTRVGARVIKCYHDPVSPAMRVIAHPIVAEEHKDRLRALQAVSDPILLLAEIRAAQEELGRRVDRRGLDASSGDPVVADVDRFAAGLKIAWRDGEQRPLHRRPYHRRKPAPHRICMLDDQETRIRAWLKAEPALSAQAVLMRLIEVLPDRFTKQHLRTVQRAVKSWRGEMARSLIRDGASLLFAATADIVGAETTLPTLVAAASGDVRPDPA
jgi:hypothetical protein